MTMLITDDDRTCLLANGQALASGQDTDPLPYSPRMLMSSGCWPRLTPQTVIPLMA